MRRHSLSLLALLVLLAPVAASAQDDDPHHDRSRRGRGIRQVDDHAGRNRRDGFWIAGGLGVGGESFDARDGLGWSDDKGGAVGYLKLGGTVSNSLLLGIEGQLWAADYYPQSYDRALGSLMGIAQWYPARRSDFWLRGGLGWARDYLEERVQDVTFRTTQRGTAYAIGAGFDFPVSRKVSITPSLDILGQHYSTHNERVVTLGVGVTFH